MNKEIGKCKRAKNIKWNWSDTILQASRFPVYSLDFSNTTTFVMDSSASTSNKVQSCDHKPLQECLKKNNNDRSKCMKEWNEFQEQCRRAK
jgi:hypothetical protein